MKTFYEMMKLLESVYPEVDSPSDSAEREFEIQISSLNPVTFEDARTGHPIPYIPGSESVVGGERDLYSIQIRVVGSAELDARDEPRREHLDTDGMYIKNNTSGKEVKIPENMSDKIVSKDGNTPYAVGMNPYQGKLNIFVEPRGLFFAP